MSNLAGKSYALTVVSPQALTWVNRLLFAVFRCLPSRLAILHNLRIIHFARWVILPADRWPGVSAGWKSRYGYMLFASNFNSTWDAYLDEFSDILSLGLDALWYRGVGFPKSLPSSPFKSYIDHNSVDSGYYYNATPGHSVRDIKGAFAVRETVLDLQARLDDLDADPSLTDLDRERLFRRDFNRAFGQIRNALSTPGVAPMAAAEMEQLSIAQQCRIQELESLRKPFGFLPRVGSPADLSRGCDAKF
jgi:hypothetical protein